MFSEKEIVEQVLKIAVFEQHNNKIFDNEWGCGGVTISCGPRTWPVHITCDPDFSGTCDRDTNKCETCGVDVPKWVWERILIINE